MDQHTVPRFYLEAFCDPITPDGHEPSLWECDLPEGRFKRRGPHNVATKSDYYSVTLPDGRVDTTVERLLSMLESNAAPIVRKLRSYSFGLTREEREHLASFVGFLLTRGPSFRGYLEAAGGKLGEVLVRRDAQDPESFARVIRCASTEKELTPERIEEMRQLALKAGEADAGYIVEGSKNLSLGQALIAAKAASGFVSRMPWKFLMSTGDPFVTGDAPVTRRNERVRAPLGPGLDLPDTEVTFPVSPSVCLLAGGKEGPEVSDIGKDRVADMNRERIRYAARHIFASSENAARTACEVYTELRRRGEAHAKALNLVIIEGNRRPRPLV